MPILLLSNKKDMKHRKQISTEQLQEAALKMGVLCAERSALNDAQSDLESVVQVVATTAHHWKQKPGNVGIYLPDHVARAVLNCDDVNMRFRRGGRGRKSLSPKIVKSRVLLHFVTHFVTVHFVTGPISS